MNQKKTLLISGILSILFLSLAFASATVDFVGVSGNNQNATPGSPVSFSFKVQGTSFGGQFDNAHLVLPTIFGTSTSWSGDTSNFTLLPDSNVSRIVSVLIPQSQPIGTYNGYINFTGNYNITESIVINALPITINVLPLSALSLSTITPLTKTSNGTISIRNTGNTQLNNVTLTASPSNSRLAVGLKYNNADFVSTTLAPNETKPVSVYFLNALSALDSGVVKVTATDTITSIASNELSLDIANIQFCKNGTHGDLEISDFSISNRGEGDDDVWNPLDDVEIEVEVSNNGDSSVSSVIVEIAIIDANTGKDVTNDFDFDEEVDIGKINEDKSKTALFEINVPSDLDEGDYKIFIKAYKDKNENTICIDNSNEFTNTYYELISIEKQFDSGVVIKKDDLLSIEAQCGENTEIRFKVYNVGDSREDSVLVVIENRELGLRQFEVINDLDEDESEEVVFNFLVPEALSKIAYDLAVSTYFDYDSGDVEDEDSYDQNSYDDLDENYKIIMKTAGCTSNNEGNAGISASLKSQAKVGSEMIIEATITNNANSAGSFIITASDFESWAKLSSIEPQSISILAGASQKVTIKLEPTKSGTQTFNLKATSNGEITTQSIQVSVSEKTGLFTGSFLGGTTGNFLLYAVIIVIVLLIIILIIAIAKVSGRKPTTSEF